MNGFAGGDGGSRLESAKIARRRFQTRFICSLVHETPTDHEGLPAVGDEG
jgi:hypothetical protein